MLIGTLPEQVNHRKLAVENQKLEGNIPLASFKRLIGSLESESGNVKIKLEFRKGRKRSTLLVGTASAELTLICQRCLSDMLYTSEVSLRHTVVDSEDALLGLDQEEDVILCLEDRISLVDIFEDELIIALPMVSKHDLMESGHDAKEDIEEGKVAQCRVNHENDDTPVDTHRPFADLAGLQVKKTGKNENEI